MEQHQFGLREWAGLCERKDATIAALQARVQELESNRVPNSMQHVIELQAMNNRLGVRVETLESQLTQRTVERDTARRRVDELEAREVDVVTLREDLEQRTAELEAANKLLYKKNCELGRFETIISDLQAELERVRALVKAYADAKTDFDDKRLQEDHHAWRERYNKLVEAENALLQHRQGMEG